MRIVIVGGGIGGLCAALALRQAGFAPEVFEQAPALLEVGAAIAVWPNALRVLLRLGIGAQVIKQAGVIKHVRWLASDGRQLNHADFPDTDVPAIALHRADLQSALLHALPADSIHLGHTCDHHEQQGDSIHVRFTDGTTHTYDLLIAADGLHSHLRTQLLNDGPPIYRGYTVWRGVTSYTSAALPPATAIETFGRGQRFGIGPVGRGRIGWWATANEPAGHDETAPGRQRRLLTLFAGWPDPILDLIAATPTTSILRTPAFDRPPTKQWGTGAMTLLGDAVHPTTPNLGQGGCMAIEDAALLARCLQHYGAPAQAALRSYERLRQARTAAITTYSRRYGRMGQLANRSAVQLRNLLLARVPEVVIQRSLRLIFAYDAYDVRL